MAKSFYVYILISTTGVLYIGVTSNLIKRIFEHKNKLVDGFTKKYNINKLIYYEALFDAENAIYREKQLKKWNRQKKIDLIHKVNPEFKEIPLESFI